MYRKTLLASVGAIVLGGSTALAADLPMTLPPPPVPVFTWTGIYVGGQIGCAWGRGNLNYSGYDPFDAISFDTGVSAAPRG